MLTQPQLRVEGDPGVPDRVGLLAASFDPMTIAHAALAEAASYTNDLVLLVTSPATLPKEGDAEEPLLDEATRALALTAWCSGRTGLRPAVASHGLLVDQARAAHVLFPDAELTTYCGSDKLLQLFDARWYDDRDAALEELFALSRVAYALRSGHRSAVAAALADPSDRKWARRCVKVPMDPALAGISSREVRRLIRSGREWRSLVPDEVSVLLR